MIFEVWTKEYYDNPVQIWTNPCDVLGIFEVENENALIRAIKARNLKPEDFRWEKWTKDLGEYPALERLVRE
jgi:hypothetical protein